MIPGEQLCTERPAYGEEASEPALAAVQKQTAERQGLGFVVWEFRIGGGKGKTRIWMQNTGPHPAQPQINTKLCPCGLTGVAGTNGVEKASNKLWRFSGLEAMSVPRLLMSQVTFQFFVQPFSPTFTPKCPFGCSCRGKRWGDYLMYCITGNKRSWCFVPCQPLLSQELIITGCSPTGELQDPGWCR